MEKLDVKYLDKLNEIKSEMMALEAYTKFLDTEEAEHYDALQEEMSPKLSSLYHQVANERPLQLLEFEQALLNEELEGMFLPRMLGYTVMRNVVNQKTFKYVLSQEHFKEVLINICNSPNFDYLRTRIGQTIQLGFGLSSDIWVTNLINLISNKKVKTYLLEQKNARYKYLEDRKYLYGRYLHQFKNDNYFTIVFPTTMAGLSVEFLEIRNFILQRIRLGVKDESLTEKLVDFVTDKAYYGSDEQFSLLILTTNFANLNEKQNRQIRSLFNELRVEMDDFEESYFEHLIEYYDIGLPLDEEADKRASMIVTKQGETDELFDFYQLSNVIHKKGFKHPDVIEAVKVFYINHDGRSRVNKALRNVILGYAGKLTKNLAVESYQDYFDLMDYFTQYIEIFDNQKFNQRIKDHSLVFIKKLLNAYTDKRGRDYQTIKRFVRSKFLELKFMNAKELTLMFKTKRKKKTKTEE